MDRRSEECLQPADPLRMLDLLPTPAIRCRSDGTLIYANAAWRALTGPAASAEGRPWFAVAEPGEQARLRSLWEVTAGAGAPVALEFHAPSIQGQPRWLSISLVPESPGSGGTEYLGSACDVTRRRVADERVRRLREESESQARERRQESEGWGRALQCIYAVMDAAHQVDASLPHVLQTAADWIPGAWREPEGTSARVVVGTACHVSAHFEESPVRLARSIVVDDAPVGLVEVFRHEGADPGSDGFHREERTLLAAVADQLAGLLERMQVERRLARSEERFRLALEATNDGVWDWNVQTDEVHYSAGWQTMLGYRPGELEPHRRAWEALLHPDDRERTFRAIEAHLAGQTEGFELEYRLRARSGQWHSILSRGRVVEHDADARPLRAVGTHTDVTDSRHAAKELARKSMVLETVMETMDQGVSMFDRDLRLVAYNTRFRELLELPPGRFVVGAHLEAFLLFAAERGDFGPGDPRFLAAEKLQEACRFQRGSREVVLPGGTVLEVKSAPLRDGGLVTTYADVTERHRAEQVVRESEGRLRSFIESANDGIVTADERGVIESFNPAAERIFGWPAVEAVGGRVTDLMPEAYRARHDAFMSQYLEDGVRRCIGVTREVVGQRSDGTRFPLEISVSEAYSGGRRTYTALVRDITARKEMEHRIWRQANYDALTDLPNRSLFHDRLRQTLARARRDGTPFALMFLDLDGFKEVNDTLGHDQGDELLKEAARRLSACVRESDTVARMGGDEFTVILQRVACAEEARAVAEKILDHLQRPVHMKAAGPVRISASIGIALYPLDGQDPDALLRCADVAMYRVKEHGRNAYRLAAVPISQADREEHSQAEAET